MSALGGGGGGGGERRYSVPSNPLLQDPRGMHSEDLHAWSIYRQNLNSDFTDSALGSTDKSPLPYGNFQLRDTTVQSILAHPRYGPKSALGSNMYTYLKFGLPRVFPPNHNGSQRSGTPRPKTSIGSGMKPAVRVHRASRGFRETSSGYDSSDNDTVNYKHSRKYRSDPDFRMQNLHQSYQGGPAMPLVAMHAAGVRASPHWSGARNKSVSEANLLGIDARAPRRPPPAAQRRDRDRSPDTDHQSYMMPTSHIGSRISKAGSHLSLAQSRKHSTLRPGTDYVDGHASYIYPNYYVNNLEITSPENRTTLLVSGLSFEVKSGEVLGVLATSQHEATGLLDVLAGLNKINVVVEELGLEQVRDTSVARLTRSERRRLDVACQLLRDPALLLLDQPTRHMDIFDTFFLVEYLRGWAAGGRAVVLSLHPPTYEIFAMLSKVVLTSAGRTMYSGYRRDMLPYFASIDYPCPAYKNPSDYYLDLVTLDDLSAAAMLESSARIEALAGVFAATRARDPPPDPPPPVPLPPPLRTANPFCQAGALLKKSLWDTQMYTMMNLISRLIVAAILSLVMGAIYWDLPSTDSKLTQGDRVGFHYAVMCVGVWPLLLLAVREVCAARRYAESDILLGLYSRPLYVLLDHFMSGFSSCIVWLAYLVPSYAMSGLYPRPKDEPNGFIFYLGFSLVYLLTLESVARASAYVTGRQRTAAALCGVLLLAASLACGALLHAADLPAYLAWTPHASPVRWALPEMLRQELTEGALRASSPEQSCINKSRPLQDIIMQCPVADGARALAALGYTRGPHAWEGSGESFAVALAIVYAAASLVAWLAFVCDCARYVRTRERRARRGHNTEPNLP